MAHHQQGPELEPQNFHGHNYASATAAPLAQTQAHVGAVEMAFLMQQIRAIIREEVRSAHVETTPVHSVKDEIQEDQEGDATAVTVKKSDQTLAEKLTGDIITTRDADLESEHMKALDQDRILPQQRKDGAQVARVAVEHEIEDKQLQEAEFPNPWAKFRHYMREPFAEFLGTMILCIFGDGVNNQVVLSNRYDPSNAKGEYLSISFGWGVATAMGIWSCGGISGGLINPSITLGLAVYRGFPWKKVPIYIVAQILGGMVGALCIYGLYVNPIRALDPDQTEATASLFTTFSADFLRTSSTRISTFYNEVLATAILFILVLAIGDSNNTPPVDGMAPLVLLWLVWGLGACLGWQSAYAVNPARDLGPRIALTIVGYEGLWSQNAYYWLWTPVLGTVVGAMLGGFIYDTLIYTGPESWMNAKWQFSDLGRLRHGRNKQKQHEGPGLKGTSSFETTESKIV